ncbi:MAG TPA: SDR family NAD(P)-dependent oxidoreductase [Gemmatimonadales bacterium]|nr:SDR family NAD(P)-dependent oxidoreductase [Gemmatimonadales bacterium]
MPAKLPALVTGATEGIGRATAFALAREGHPVAVCARTASKVDALVAELRASGFQAAGAACDVADPVSVTALCRAAEQALGPIGVLVNNAGIARLKPFQDLTLEDWDATIATNLRSLYLTTREVLPGMRQRREGTIVNVASLAARNGFAGGTVYSASKHAVLGFSRSLMLEVRKENVRVITICPGSVETPLMKTQTALSVRLDHILQPEDVATAIVDALRLPARAMVSEIDLRPTDP